MPLLPALALATALTAPSALRTIWTDASGHASYDFVDKTSDAILGDLFAFDYYDAQPLGCDAGVCEPTANPALAGGLCFVGDIGKVCSTLSVLSKKDAASYQGGDHIWAHLDACRVHGRGKPVVATVRLVHDYASYEILVPATIERCAE